MPRQWTVVGGVGSGGLLVRSEGGLSSAKLPARLSTGALVQEVEFLESGAGQRLHYRKLQGDGPDEGWISVVVNGKTLAEVVPEVPAADQDDNEVKYGEARERALKYGIAWHKGNQDAARRMEQEHERRNAFLQQNESRKDVASVRMLLDADPVEVGNAVARSLLLGRPGVMNMHTCERGCLRWRDTPELGLPMPLPVSQEWKSIATSSNQFQEESVWWGGLENSNDSFSLGLRPLFPDETILPGKGGESEGFHVALHTGRTSHFSARERRACQPQERDFRVGISSPSIGDAFAHCLLPGDTDRDEELASITCSCQVRAVGSGHRAELERTLHGGSAMAESFPGPKAHGKPDFSNPVALVASRIVFMLEMETRAWLSNEQFGLVEVWRGVRRPIQWAVFSTLAAVGSYTYTVGHAAHASSEVSEGACFDMGRAARLEGLLPKRPPDSAGTKGGQFVEGFVSVVSFSQLLSRVCRRAKSHKIDIYRCFVDLGSGRGHAVLAAHALHPFRCCRGYEIDPEIVRAAQEFSREYVMSGLARSARSSGKPDKLFIQGDFLNQLDWSDASIVFANAVTWPSAMLRDIAKRALKLRRGSVLLLAVRQMPVDDPAVLEAFDVRGEACMMSFSATKSVQLWAYQRR